MSATRAGRGGRASDSRRRRAPPTHPPRDRGGSGIRPDERAPPMTPKYHINLFWSEPDGAWVADVPDLQSCAALGDTPADALAEIAQAIAARLEVARKDGRRSRNPATARRSAPAVEPAVQMFPRGRRLRATSGRRSSPRRPSSWPTAWPRPRGFLRGLQIPGRAKRHPAESRGGPFFAHLLLSHSRTLASRG